MEYLHYRFSAGSIVNNYIKKVEPPKMSSSGTAGCLCREMVAYDSQTLGHRGLAFSPLKALMPVSRGTNAYK